jgi:hypothetical protein
MKIKQFLILFLAINFTFGCSTISNERTQQIGIEPSIFDNSTSTPLIYNPTAIGISNASTKPPSITDCFPRKDLQNEPDVLSDLPGKIFLKKFGNDPVIIPDGLNAILVPDDRWMNAISPDGKKYSYILGTLNNEIKRLIVEDSQGNTTDFSFTSDLFWRGSIGEWLNNDEVLFSRNPSESRKLISKQTVINPFSKEMKDFPEKFPGIEPTVFTNLNNFYHKDMIFSPDGKYVAYISTQNNPVIEFVVWDIINNKPIVKKSTTPNEYSLPVWSSNSESIYYPISPNPSLKENHISEKPGWYKIRTDGSITQLVDFSNIQPTPIIQTAALSPNGRKIAFWWQGYKNNDFSHYNLSILNLQDRTIENFCEKPLSSEPTIPVWSPDSRYVIVTSEINKDVFSQSTILIDTKDHWYSDLIKNSRIVGWMIK